MKQGHIQVVEENTRNRQPQKKRKKTLVPLVFIMTVLLAAGCLLIKTLFPSENNTAPDIRTHPEALSKDLLAQQEVIQDRADNEKNKSGLISDKVFNLVGKDNENGIGGNILNFIKTNVSQSFSLDEDFIREDAGGENPIDFESVSDSISDRIQNTIPIQSNPLERTGDAESGENKSNPGRSTMFVYSRSFKKAKYYDRKKIQKSLSENVPTPPDSIEKRLYRKMGIHGTADKKEAEHEENTITTMIYNQLPVIRIFEGDFIDGVLLNQLVADSRESPVIIGITKDMYDRYGQFIVFPTNTRFIGYSRIIRSQGASRLFIGMKKIILPNNAVINIPPAKRFPGLENDGSLGIQGKVKGHFLKKFGSTLFVGLLNGLGGIAQNRINPYSGWGGAISKSSENFSEIGNRMIQHYLNIVPTIQIPAGHRIKIYFTSDYIISPYQTIQYPQEES